MYSESPYINLSSGAQLLGDQEVARDLLSRFIRKLETELKKIKQFRSEEDWKKFYEALHKLHGAACYSSTPKILEILKKIEERIYPPIVLNTTPIDKKIIDHLLHELDVSCSKTLEAFSILEIS